jgi:hypothetical protein
MAQAAEAARGGLSVYDRLRWRRKLAFAQLLRGNLRDELSRAHEG